VLSQMQPLKGVNKDGSPYTKVQDGISGKYFNSPADLLEYYNL